LFQTVHRRREISSEQQRDMEQAFEDLFVRCQGTNDNMFTSIIITNAIRVWKRSGWSREGDPPDEKSPTTGRYW